MDAKALFALLGTLMVLTAPLPGAPLDLSGAGAEAPYLVKRLEPDAFFKPLSPPVFVPAAGWADGGPAGLKDEDWCLEVLTAGVPRIYPVPVMVWHEVANDRETGRPPLAVTYCILTGTAAVFSSDFGGARADFGVSGYLYQSNLVLFDYQSRSAWSQAGARALAGPRKGTALPLVPFTFLRWSEARDLPGALVCAGTAGPGMARERYRKAPLQALETYPDDGEIRAPVVPGALADRRFPAKERFAYFPRSQVAVSFTGLASQDHPLVRATRKDGRLVSVAPAGDEPFLTLYWFGLRALYPDAQVAF